MWFAGLGIYFRDVLHPQLESGVFDFCKIPPIFVLKENRTKTDSEICSETGKPTFRVKGSNFAHLVDFNQGDLSGAARDAKNVLKCKTYSNVTTRSL